MRRFLCLAVLAAVLTIAAQTVIAEETETPHHEHDFHRNHLALFLGATSHDSKTGFASGFDYEFRPLAHLGFGIVAD